MTTIDLRELPGNIEVGGKVLATNGVDHVVVKDDTTNGNKYIPFVTGAGTLRTARRSNNLYIDAANRVLNCNAASCQSATQVASASQSTQCQGTITQAVTCTTSGTADVAGTASFASFATNTVLCQGSNNYFAWRAQQSSNYSSKIYTGSGTSGNGIYWQNHGGGLYCANSAYGSPTAGGNCWRMYNNNSVYYAENTSWVIEGDLFSTDYSDPQHDWWSKDQNNAGWAIGDAPAGTVTYGVEVVFDCSAYGWAATSDRRIKRDIVELDDEESLTILRKLKPCKYNYVPSYNINKNKQIGFIAQEVGEVLPGAVSLDTKMIPNIACIAEVKYGTDENLVTLNLTNELPTDVTVEKNTKLTIGTPSKGRVNVIVVNVLSNTIFEVKAEYEDYFKYKPPRVFVYGTIVNDFNHLFKDKIWAVGVSALQQIDRIHNNQKNLLSNIHTDYDQTMLYISDLKNTCSSIINRLDRL